MIESKCTTLGVLVLVTGDEWLQLMITGCCSMHEAHIIAQLALDLIYITVYLIRFVYCILVQKCLILEMCII